MRGKGLSRAPLPRRVGITPACAGKSTCALVDGGRAQDHPRVCGEKGAQIEPVDVITGSPPRVRGKVLCICKNSKINRITPACAGKSVASGKIQVDFEDHPRVCGEKMWGLQKMYWTKGSPPRVRGKVAIAHCQAVLPRITPACAGKSLRGNIPALPDRDHPRVCGEKRFA